MPFVLFQYSGVDLAAAALTVLSVFWLGSHDRRGFPAGLAGNILWMIIAVWSHGPWLLVTNLVLAGLNLRGYLTWHHHHS